MLNERREKIITLLKNNKNWITGKEMSQVLNVSDRTIRSDISHINIYYDNILIESDNRKGYHLNKRILSSMSNHSENIIPQTSFQRCFYIVHELLFKKNELNLIYAMNRLFISNSSMENDLKEIKKMLEVYPTLKLIRHKNYISIEGNEENKRELYINLLKKKMRKNYLNLDFLATLFSNLNFFSIKELLENILNKYKLNIREMELPTIMAYVGVAIERMLYCNYIQTHNINKNISIGIELSVSKEFYQSMSKNLNIILDENESFYLAFLLCGKLKTQRCENEILQDSNCMVNQLVNTILKNIYIQFDVDLREDEDLKEGLSAHILQLLERKKNNVNICNLFLDELKYKYPFFFEMSVCVGKIIEEHLNVAIDEIDISFIEQHLGAALERINSKSKYKVILINPNNQALSSLCQKKIESIFHERMIIVKSMNYFEKKEIIKIEPDLILTTLSLEHNLNILTVQISIFINSQDEIKIFQALNLMDGIRFKDKFVVSFKNMIEPRFFYLDLDINTPEEVLTFMSNELYNAGYVDKEFKESVLKREELSPTSFIYSFAIPHPIKSMSRESKISVAVLKKPIQWGKFQVKLVLLLSIQKNSEKIMRTFFDWFSYIVSDSQKLSCLMKIKGYDDFINQII